MITLRWRGHRESGLVNLSWPRGDGLTWPHPRVNPWTARNVVTITQRPAGQSGINSSGDVDKEAVGRVHHE